MIFSGPILVTKATARSLVAAAVLFNIMRLNWFIMEVWWRIGMRMRLCWITKLEAKIQVCCSIQYIEVKTSLAGSSDPDLHYLMETAEEECLLRVVEGGGSGTVHPHKLGKVN